MKKVKSDFWDSRFLNSQKEAKKHSKTPVKMRVFYGSFSETTQNMPWDARKSKKGINA
jgi:hypothetical protein